eukprot:1238938-Amphidinium_carterae.1
MPCDPGPFARVKVAPSVPEQGLLVGAGCDFRQLLPTLRGQRSGKKMLETVLLNRLSHKQVSGNETTLRTQATAYPKRRALPHSW